MVSNNYGSSRIALLISVVSLVVAGVALFGGKKKESVCDSSTFDEQVRQIIIDTMRQNPQLLMDAMGEGISKKREDSLKQLSKGVAEEMEEVSKLSLKFGRLESKTGIICFFDPVCSHCIDFQRKMVKMVKSNLNVSFKMIPVGALGDDSRIYSKTYFAIYAKNPKKALAFIEKFTDGTTSMDRENVTKTIKAIGLNPKEIEGMMEDAGVKLEQSEKLLEKLRIPIVPAAFVVRGRNIELIKDFELKNLMKITGNEDAILYNENESNQGSDNINEN